MTHGSWSGLDYTYSRYPGEYIDGQYCNTCEPGQHSIENCIDEDEDNWWQSSSLAVIPDYNQKMNIELFLGQVCPLCLVLLIMMLSAIIPLAVRLKETVNGKTIRAALQPNLPKRICYSPTISHLIRNTKLFTSC
jgi:hypothetical protein